MIKREKNQFQKAMQKFAETKIKNIDIDDKKVKSNYQKTIAISFIILITGGLLWNKLPNKVPLFYSRIWGEKRLAKKEELILLIGGLGLGVSLINLIISRWLERQQEATLMKIVGTATMMIVGLLALVMINVIIVVW